MNDRYEGTVFLCTAGSEYEHATCRDSINGIRTRQGDVGPYFGRGTKGYEVRQGHLNKFIDGKHDFILMLDHDMTFPPDTLERLRSHGLPYVSGFYMRRRYDPIAPVWFLDNPKGAFPFQPYVGIPGDGLERIGASGWGCVLLHREVVLAVRELLKGEPEIIEDDMDMQPYDLGAILAAVRGLAELADEMPKKKLLQLGLRYHIQTLQREIVPLRGDKQSVIGSDIRFPYFARKAGYQLWGDPKVRCGHMLNYPLSVDDYKGLASPEFLKHMKASTEEKVSESRQRIERLVARLNGGQS